MFSAADWLFSHVDNLDAAVQEVLALRAASDASATTADPLSLVHDSGEGVYELFAVVSHMGKNTEHGHYVCHLKHATHGWVLYNDEKVAQSVNPPLEYGFMYFYRRVSTA